VPLVVATGFVVGAGFVATAGVAGDDVDFADESSGFVVGVGPRIKTQIITPPNATTVNTNATTVVR
jgi:hypothetical protein